MGAGGEVVYRSSAQEWLDEKGLLDPSHVAWVHQSSFGNAACAQEPLQTMTAVDVNVSGTYPLFGREHELMVGYGEAKNDNTSPLMTNLNPADYDTVPDWRDMSTIPKYQDRDSGIEGSHNVIKQKSGYLATRLNLTDEWHAVLGTRYGSWKSAKASNEFDEDSPGGVHYQKITQTHNDMLTPYAGVLYDFTENLTAYVSYTDIFKPSNSESASGSYLEPVVGSNYELGLKGSFLQERLNLSSAVFWSKQDNVPEIDDSVPRGPKGEVEAVSIDALPGRIAAECWCPIRRAFR